MCQRVMIAMALACEPDAADRRRADHGPRRDRPGEHPRLLREIQADTGIAILFISHDLGVIAEIAERVVVMYAGQVIEAGTAGNVFARLRHPYTEGLLASIPNVGDERLQSIPGSVPMAGRHPSGCRFHPRCTYFAAGRCDVVEPALELLDAGHAVRCLRALS